MPSPREVEIMVKRSVFPLVVIFLALTISVCIWEMTKVKLEERENRSIDTNISRISRNSSYHQKKTFPGGYVFDHKAQSLAVDFWSKVKEYLGLRTQNCNVYNTSKPITRNFTCVNIHIKPPGKICIYNPETDVWISKSLQSYGKWEADIMTAIETELNKDKTMGFIDLGANLGVFTIMAAKMGAKVVAVEPNMETLQHLHKSLQLNHLQEKVCVLYNAVADSRRQVWVTINPKNRGGTSMKASKHQCKHGCETKVQTVLLNDLLEVIPFKRAIMKMDIEGFEHYAFKHADQLFADVDIPVVLTEWLQMKKYHNQTAFPKDHVLVNNMIHFLNSRSYIPYQSYRRGKPLHWKEWNTWPTDVFWIKE